MVSTSVLLSPMWSIYAEWTSSWSSYRTPSEMRSLGLRLHLEIWVSTALFVLGIGERSLQYHLHFHSLSGASVQKSIVLTGEGVKNGDGLAAAEAFVIGNRLVVGDGLVDAKTLVAGDLLIDQVYSYPIRLQLDNVNEP